MTSTFRESKEMLARVSRSESETENAARRIEDHLRSLARRLDSSEQTKTSSSQVLNGIAQDTTPQDNAQIFGTLGTHVISLGERLDRLEERASANAAGNASVRGLQDGLARMADQMADTAKQSASQISVLATAMEAVVTKMSEAHEQAASGVSALGARIGHIDERIGVLETTLHVKDEATERALQRLEQRSGHYDEIVEQLLAGVEERHAAIRDEFKHSLQALDSRYGMRRKELEQAIATTRDAQDDVRARIGRLEDHFAADRDDASRNGITAEQLQRLEETIERLTARVAAHEDQAASTLARLEDAIAHPAQPEAAEVGSRVYGIEQSLQDLMDRLEDAERRSATSSASIDEQLRALSGRIEGFDRDTREAISELHLSLHHTAGRLELIETATPAPAATAQAGETLFAEHWADEAPAQPAAVEPIADDHPDDLMDVPADDTALTQDTPNGDVPAGDDAVTPGFADSAIHRAFGQRPAGDFVSVTAQDEDLFRDERTLAADEFAAHAAQNDFLGARRSALASAATDSESMATTLGGFTWGARREAQPVQEEQPRSRVLLIGAIALVAILAIGAGVMLSQQMGSHARVTTAPAAHPAALPASVAAVAGHAAKPAPAPELPAAEEKPAAPEKLAVQAPAAPAPKVMATGDRLTTLANGGNVKAQLLVGLKFLDGDGVKTNEAEAAKWLQRAADQGEPIAQYRLGTLYERGHGVATNAAKAVQLYSAAAHQGNRKAMHNLAVAYAEGAGTQKNYAEAARWFGRAAALGLADSQFNLAVLYERGLGVPQSLSQAYKWYAVAATQGDTESKARVVALSSQLSPADLDVAQRAASSFRAEPLNRAANVTPETPGRG